ncbi:MAG: hypothetical protein RTU30_03990, partial [Candidatus Thorarchaeota archaeon]
MKLRSARTLLGVALIVSLSVASIGVFLLQSNPASEDHFQMRSTVYDAVALSIRDAKGANVTVRFTDDPSLVYNIEITPYPDSVAARIEQLHLDSANTTSFLVHCRGRQQGINVTLSTRIYYYIDIGVTNGNLSTSIIYDNGAKVCTPASLMYHSGGSLFLSFTDNINATGNASIYNPSFLGDFIGYIECNHLVLNVNLNDSYSAGWIDFQNSTVTSTLEDWRNHGGGIFLTIEYTHNNT